MMKKTIIISLTVLLSLPMLAQRMTKQEREAAGKAAYEIALKNIEQRSFVIVPTTYTNISDNSIEDNTDIANFFSVEGENLFAQGSMICGNSHTNILEASEYSVKVDKKGNIKMRIVVNGRMMNGIYTISIRNNTDIADVIFAPNSGSTRKFTGPVLPLNASYYNKRSNPM